MRDVEIAVSGNDMTTAASEVDQGILFLVDFESMLPDGVDTDHLEAARRLLASARLTIHGEVNRGKARVTPIADVNDFGVLTKIPETPVAFTDAQVDHLKGMLDVAHHRVFRGRSEPRSDASAVEALLEGALYRAAGATALKLPLRDPGAPPIPSDDPDDDAAQKLVHFTTDQLINQLRGRLEVLESIVEGRGFDLAVLQALADCLGRKPGKSEAAQ